MPQNSTHNAQRLTQRNFLNTADLPQEEIIALIDLALSFKHGNINKTLTGKTLATLFFNPSVRTRVSFASAMFKLGGQALDISSEGAWAFEYRDGIVMDGSTIEHVKEVAPVLSRYCDAIAIRCSELVTKSAESAKVGDWHTAKQDIVLNSFAKYATVPIINMESNVYHPCQGLGDAVTIKEKLGHTQGKKYVLTWAYHPKALPMATPNSQMLAACDLGMDVVLAHPEGWDLHSCDRRSGTSFEAAGSTTSATWIRQSATWIRQRATWIPHDAPWIRQSATWIRQSATSSYRKAARESRRRPRGSGGARRGARKAARGSRRVSSWIRRSATWSPQGGSWIPQASSWIRQSPDIEPARPLVDPAGVFVDPAEPDVEPARPLVDPSGVLVDPAERDVDPARPLVDPAGNPTPSPSPQRGGEGIRMGAWRCDGCDGATVSCPGTYAAGATSSFRIDPLPSPLRGGAGGGVSGHRSSQHGNRFPLANPPVRVYAHPHPRPFGRAQVEAPVG